MKGLGNRQRVKNPRKRERYTDFGKSAQAGLQPGLRRGAPERRPRTPASKKD